MTLNELNKTYYRWYILFLGMMAYFFIAGLPRMCMPVLFKEISEDIGLSLVEIGTIWGMDPLAGVFIALPGGLIAEMEVTLPAVLGIQAAEEPPRYVAISKIRQTMKTASMDELEVAEFDCSGGPVIERMFQPEAGERATMIEGDEEEVAARLIEIFKESGVL